MTNEEIIKLKTISKAAAEDDTGTWNCLQESFQETCTPAVVLELLEKLRELEGAEKVAIRGGADLGAVRRWIKWNCVNGDQVTWGSHQDLGRVTVLQLEELAQRIADGVEALS